MSHPYHFLLWKRSRDFCLNHHDHHTYFLTSSPLPHIPFSHFPASPHSLVLFVVGLSGCYDPAESRDTIHFSSITTTYFITTFAVYYFRHRIDRPKITLPPRKRLGIDLGPRYEIGESSAVAATRPVGGRRADYGFVDPREAIEEVALITLRGVNTMVTELTTVQEQDTQDIYAVIEDTQDRQTQIYQSVGTLVNDMLGQQAVISQLQAADRKSQVVTLEMLQADYQRQVQLTKALELLKGLQTQMAEFQRQLGPAKGLTQPDAPGEAGSSS
ncbi:hypothetical protein Tco_1094432 [Tanacetum coccineum]|uniref:Uncharacterized protein n=1 Tax=Tanacetum coccineum TaxID=301880 RepID=A0ABQ5IGY4_9ASTR